jgi:hypothetical protein
MKTTIPTMLGWSSATAAALSSAWLFSLAALVVRCKLSGPFPVLAKFSPFHNHLNLTTSLAYIVFPVFALIAALLVGSAWYFARNFRAVRAAAIVSAALVILSLVVLALNPGDYLSWFLS